MFIYILLYELFSAIFQILDIFIEVLVFQFMFEMDIFVYGI